MAKDNRIISSRNQQFITLNRGRIIWVLKSYLNCNSFCTEARSVLSSPSEKLRDASRVLWWLVVTSIKVQNKSPKRQSEQKENIVLRSLPQESSLWWHKL